MSLHVRELYVHLGEVMPISVPDEPVWKRTSCDRRSSLDYPGWIVSVPFTPQPILIIRIASKFLDDPDNYPYTNLAWLWICWYICPRNAALLGHIYLEVGIRKIPSNNRSPAPTPNPTIRFSVAIPSAIDTPMITNTINCLLLSTRDRIDLSIFYSSVIVFSIRLYPQ